MSAWRVRGRMGDVDEEEIEMMWKCLRNVER